MTRSVVFVASGGAEGNREVKAELGGTGANLAEMTNLGVPVPPVLTIAAGLRIDYLRERAYPAELRAEAERNGTRLEECTARGFGDESNPLLVSVRSGAAVSMPGMTETILYVGLTDRTVAGLAQQSGNARVAYYSYRRFLQM